jgi:hypothetical protein
MVEHCRLGVFGFVLAAAMATNAACSSDTKAPPATAGRNEDAAPGLPDSGVLAAVDDGASSEGATEGGGGDEGTSGCVGVPILPDMGGYVAPSSNALKITGAWYSYIDCNDYAYFNLGTPMPGTNCSLMSTPTPGAAFIPVQGTQGRMCTRGTTVQVMSQSDWQTHWGAGVGIDLNNVGGTKQVFDAVAAGVRGFCFVLSGATIPPLHVNMPSDQNITDNWYFKTVSTPGVQQVLFTDLSQQTRTATPFDPSKLWSVQFLIPASMSAAVPWDFCIEGLTALM